MSIFVDETTKVVIQGISPTSQGLYHGLRNKAYGTKVVGGTNPKRGGEEIEGIPVFASVAEAVKETGATASFIVPPRGAADAIIEAAEAGIAFIVCITEGIPAQDEAVVYNRLVRGVPRHPAARPELPGDHQPREVQHRHHLGRHRARREGRWASSRRSGTLTYQALHELSQQGIGQTTCVGIGGDPVPGTNFIDCLAAFEADPETKAVMMIGEIGGSEEERAAEFIAANMTKPVAAYIAGRHRAPGPQDGPRRRHHLGLPGTAQAKMEALSAAGVHGGARTRPSAARRWWPSCGGSAEPPARWRCRTRPGRRPVPAGARGRRCARPPGSPPSVPRLCLTAITMPVAMSQIGRPEEEREEAERAGHADDRHQDGVPPERLGQRAPAPRLSRMPRPVDRVRKTMPARSSSSLFWRRS